MFKLPVFIKKVLLIVMIVGIGLSALPVADVSAAGTNSETAPPSTSIDRTARLERAWARELAIYERQGKLLDNAGTVIDRVQSLIDRATEKGLDASAVQAALDAFESAVLDARPIHQSANGIVTSHKGFDESGQVTDGERARETVWELAEHLRDFQVTMDGTGQALREAIKAFFETNRLHRQNRP